MASKTIRGSHDLKASQKNHGLNRGVEGGAVAYGRKFATSKRMNRDIRKL